MPLEVGQLIEGKYRIARLIGEGGMGAVYEGENVRINRRVAIKVLHAGFTGNAEVMQRFDREAQAAGRIGNDHILEVLDLGGLADGDHFIVMEYLDGEPLSARIRDKGRLQPHELAPIIRQVLVGLGAAHQAGIVHRDLKPDNIFILKEKAGTHDFVKIIDFGISKFQPLSGDGMKMTRTGAVMGTPYYMSPEQASGSHEADHRSDLYSLGVILFEAVTGRVPFDASTFNQLMFKIVLDAVPTAESVVPGLDPAFSSIISKAMARDVAHRFQSAREFMQAIDDWVSRGAAVALPPPDRASTYDPLAPSNVGAAAPALTSPMPPRGPGNGTAGNWAKSQPETISEPAPKKRPSGLVWGIGALAALGLVGGTLLALGSSSDSSADAQTSSATQPDAPPRSPEPEAKKAVEATPPTTALPVTPEPPTIASSAAIAASSAPAEPKRAPVEPARHGTSKPQKASAPERKEPIKPTKSKSAVPDFGY